jgi:hypothetical protein
MGVRSILSEGLQEASDALSHEERAMRGCVVKKGKRYYVKYYFAG